MSGLPKLTRFNDNVLSKYQIYNSIFMTLPFDAISNTGVLLPLFHKVCEKGYQQGKNPSELTYDYKRSLDRNLPRKFLLKNDPTRWYLQSRQSN